MLCFVFGLSIWSLFGTQKKLGVSLVSHVVIEDITDPYVIVNDWPLADVEGKEYYESPLVRRKMDWENSN